MISPLTGWLTVWLNNKHNSILAKATGLISLLFNVTSSGDVPFCQLQQLQCLHHGSTGAYLWVPFLYPLLRRLQFAVLMLWLRCETKVRAELAGALLTLFFAWNIAQHVRKTRSEAKHSDTPWLSDTPAFESITKVCALTIEHSIFSVMAGLIVDILLRLFFVFNTAL